MTEGSRSETGRSGRTWSIIGLVVVLLVAAGGLWVAQRSDSEGVDEGADGGLDEVGGVPILAGAYRAEGELDDGFTIPPDTVLLGDVLPTDDVLPPASTDYVPGWRAQLLVVGDVAAVLDDLDQQAQDLGFGPYHDQFQTGGCAATDYQPPEGLVECRRAWQDDTDWVSASLLRGVVPAGFSSDTARPVSLLTIDLGHLPAGSPANGSPAAPAVEPPSTVTAPPPTATATAPALRAPRPSDTTTPDQPLPAEWPEPPGPGQRLGDGIVPDNDGSVLSLRLPDGAAAIVAPWPTGGNAPTYAALVAVTGDLDAVMDDISSQVRSEFGPDSSRVEDGAIRRVTGDDAGGGKLYVTAVTVDGRSWITVSTGYD